MFIYVFYLHLKSKLKNEKIYGSYWSGALKEHSGFQLSEIFDIQLPPLNKVTTLICKICSIMERAHVISREETKFRLI